MTTVINITNDDLRGLRDAHQEDWDIVKAHWEAKKDTIKDANERIDTKYWLRCEGNTILEMNVAIAKSIYKSNPYKD